MYSKKLTIVVVTLKFNTLVVFLSSIKNITTKEIELIVVNQTFTDINAKISKFVKLDFKVINTEELMSASSARNFGAEYAEGEYIYFADDDSEMHNVSNKLLLILL